MNLGELVFKQGINLQRLQSLQLLWSSLSLREVPAHCNWFAKAINMRSTEGGEMEEYSGGVQRAEAVVVE